MSLRPRVAMIAYEYPTEHDPTLGLSLYGVARELSKEWNLRVFCLVPRYPAVPFLQPHTYSRTRPDVSREDSSVEFVNFPVLPYVTRNFNAGTCARSARAALQKFRPDLIIAYYIYPHGCAAVRLGQELGVPVVISSRGSDLLRIPNRQIQNQISSALRQADAVIGVS